MGFLGEKLHAGDIWGVLGYGTVLATGSIAAAKGGERWDPAPCPRAWLGSGSSKNGASRGAPRNFGNPSVGNSSEAPCWEASGFSGAARLSGGLLRMGETQAPLSFSLLSLVSCRFFGQSLAADPPQPRCGVFSQAPQRDRRGMEKAAPALSEHQGDGGRALLMTLEPNKENFAALECPQGEERRAAFVKDAKAPLESPALSGTALEAGTELKEAAFYGADNLAMMSREGKGSPGTELCPLQEDPNFFSPLARKEPDIALEARDVAGKTPGSPRWVHPTGWWQLPVLGVGLSQVWGSCPRPVGGAPALVRVGCLGLEAFCCEMLGIRAKWGSAW